MRLFHPRKQTTKLFKGTRNDIRRLELGCVTLGANPTSVVYADSDDSMADDTINSAIYNSHTDQYRNRNGFTLADGGAHYLHAASRCWMRKPARNGDELHLWAMQFDFELAGIQAHMDNADHHQHQTMATARRQMLKPQASINWANTVVANVRLAAGVNPAVMEDVEEDAEEDIGEV